MTEFRNRLLLRVLAPAAEPISVDDAKLYLRITDTAEDSLIGNLITAAHEAAEAVLGKSLITQRWMLAYDEYIDEPVRLPRGPVTQVISVQLIAEDASVQTLDSAEYALDAAKAKLIFSQELWAHRIEIVYEAGFGASANTVLAAIRQGMLCHVAALYENRGEGDALPAQAQQLYAAYGEVRL